MLEQTDDLQPEEKLTVENNQLKEQLMNISLINELGKVLHTTSDHDKIMHTILLGIKEIIGFHRIIFFEINKSSFSIVPKAWIGVKDENVKKLNIGLGFDGGDISDSIFLKRHLLVSRITPEDDIFAKVLSSNSYLVLPMIGMSIPDFTTEIPNAPVSNESTDKNLTEDDRRKKELVSTEFKTQGVFWMDHTSNNRPITSDDISMLSMITTQASILFDNIRMYNAIEVANENLKSKNNELKVMNTDLREAQGKINQDLEHARQIQQGLLPQDVPETDNLKIASEYIPADAVGGDYYDAFKISPGIFGIIVADVSGHGVAASLIMSMVKVLLKTFADSIDTPQATLEKINEIFQAEINTSNFVTVFYSIIDTNKNQLTYTSAGHCPILLLEKSSSKCNMIKADGLFLGVFPDMMLKQVKMNFNPGEHRFILFTDGIIEARNSEGVMFENNRLEEIAIKTLKQKPNTALKNIIKCQKKFCGKNHIPDDDFTLLVIDF